MKMKRKRIKEVNRQDVCSQDDLRSPIQVIVQNGKGKVTFRPTLEIVGLKYGERVKTRTVTRKIALNKKSQTDKRNSKKK